MRCWSRKGLEVTGIMAAGVAKPRPKSLSRNAQRKTKPTLMRVMPQTIPAGVLAARVAACERASVAMPDVVGAVRPYVVAMTGPPFGVVSALPPSHRLQLPRAPDRGTRPQVRRSLKSEDLRPVEHLRQVAPDRGGVVEDDAHPYDHLRVLPLAEVLADERAQPRTLQGLGVEGGADAVRGGVQQDRLQGLTSGDPVGGAVTEGGHHDHQPGGVVEGRVLAVAGPLPRARVLPLREGGHDPGVCQRGGRGRHAVAPGASRRTSPAVQLGVDVRDLLLYGLRRLGQRGEGLERGDGPDRRQSYTF